MQKPEDMDINQQHLELVNKLYRLRDVIKDGESRKNIEQVIDEVISYTRFHLEYEERVMDQYRYPDLDWHKDRHEELLHDVLQFKEKLRYVGEDQFLEWFNHWPMSRLHAHIEFADKQAEDYILQSREKP